MSLSRFFHKITPGFKIIDVKEWISKGYIEVIMKKDVSGPRMCARCHHELENAKVSEHKMRVRSMDIHGFKCFYVFKRQKHKCLNCKKIRSEEIDFISEESPHVTREFAWWLARLCEIAPVSRIAEFASVDQVTLWRSDFKRMKRLFQSYKIPQVRKIAVDEVYARRSRYKHMSRDNNFFTIITDLETRKVIWVSQSRSKEALDEFYHVIGVDRCAEIELVAMDQYDGYRKSTEEYCPKAIIVWDRFHIMKNLNEAINKDRAWLYKHVYKKDERMSGKYKRLFLKRADRRSIYEKRQLKELHRDNYHLITLELIKEGMHEFYQSTSITEAREKFDQINEWIDENSLFTHLKDWWENLNKGWETLKNYFRYPASSALSEGMNNVIKTIKKRAYGYKNMQYFKLKILQVCGYLNSKWIPMNYQ